MKKMIIIIALFLMTMVNTFASASELVLETSNINIDTQIEQLYVNMPSRIFFIDSEETNIYIQTSEQYIRKYIRYEIKDTTLSITIDSRFLGDDFVPNNVRIFVSSPTYMKIVTPRTLMVADNRKTLKPSKNEIN